MVSKVVIQSCKPRAIFMRLPCLVYGMTDQQVERYFNISSYRRVDQDWHIVLFLG